MMLEPLDPRQWQINGFARTRKIYVDGYELTPEKSLQFARHGDRLEWGYIGSGPKQTALAILLLFEIPAKAEKLYMQYYDDVVKFLPHLEDWSLTGGQVLDWIDSQPGE